MAVADQQDRFDFASSEAKEIVADHERGWHGFTRGVVWGVSLTVAVLLGLLIFVA
jgi:hypothetical protein